jgi:DivIVA domain-containing protein
MSLTPADIRRKEFTTVRLREGYDEKEVDAFLDEVQGELARLLAENEKLRSASAEGGSAPEHVTAATTPDAGAATPDAAVRMLALAQRTADETVAEARQEADRLLADSRGAAEELQRSAQGRADELDQTTAARRRELLGELERDRDALQRSIEQLRAFEREYRSRLAAYLQERLRDLDTTGVEVDEAPGPADADPDEAAPFVPTTPRTGQAPAEGPGPVYAGHAPHDPNAP